MTNRPVPGVLEATDPEFLWAITSKQFRDEFDRVTKKPPHDRR